MEVKKEKEGVKKEARKALLILGEGDKSRGEAKPSESERAIICMRPVFTAKK